MPYSTVIPATPGSLKAVIGYLINPDHDHHLDYQLTPLLCSGVGSIDEFKDVCVRRFQRNKKKGVGAPPKNAFVWLMIRMPEGANLSPEEMKAYEKAAIEVGSMGGDPCVQTGDIGNERARTWVTLLWCET